MQYVQAATWYDESANISPGYVAALRKQARAAEHARDRVKDKQRKAERAFARNVKESFWNIET